ncbi:HpcH/HpaI aldolase family protein [Sphingomonas bacterium]|uniref:HpcH/HpaI aldolase family protein n=1 Tax=Sphingomonas bacterium TaxID=1895847 RepID=UPI001576ED3B|nr:aldolase/citrate lyase family protein [Sphingomonas bacterium]
MLKQRLAAREPLLGTFLKTPHPHVVEVLATAGLDLLCLDAEHAPLDRTTLDLCVMAARAGNLATLVRPASGSPESVLAALDAGATGIIAPHIRSAADARALVASAHYGPGGRGYAASTRAAGYGLATMEEHLARSAAETVVVAQIEDADALESVEEIAAVEGLDALFIGRADLTVSLGCSSQDDPRIIAAVERIVDICVARGLPVGMFLGRPGDTSAWRDRGASLFLLGSDHSFMRAGAAQMRAITGL